MKKVLSILLCAAVLLSLGVVAPAAEGSGDALSADLCVTIADKDGKTVVAAEPITVTDTDSDGVLTVSDALYTAHEQFYEGGAAAGYATGETQYGMSLEKLWGAANGGSYGYFVNNSSAWSLTDPVKDGDYVAAFVYTDLSGWSDHYSYFDRFRVAARPDEQIELTYNESGYNEKWEPVVLPVEGAKIIVNGAETADVTDSDGTVSLTFSEPGTYVVSATAEGKTLVAPVAVVTVALSADLCVTIADKDGKTVVAAEPITVTDTDSDGVLTVSDALYTAHEQFYEGGAAAGYATGETQYGMSLEKLWGAANGGSYGYFVNNSSAWSLTDPVRDGDYVAAFVYTDLSGWSDHYSYFDRFRVAARPDEQIELTYNESGYNEKWEPVVLPVEGAKITVNGAETADVTDSDGTVSLAFSEPGTYVVSATAEGKTLVAPVCIITVRPAAALIGDADRNGAVEILDATCIQRRLAALITDEEIDMANADADRSGAVDILDATAIQRWLAGIIPEL